MRKTKRRRVKRRKTRRRSVGGGAQGPFMVRIETKPELPEPLIDQFIINVWKNRANDNRTVEFTHDDIDYTGNISLVDHDTINVFNTGTYKIIDYIGGKINAYIIEQTDS